MKELTPEERERFMYSYGEYYAALGGLFGAYKDAIEAFPKAAGFLPYRQLNINAVQDFSSFEKGFRAFQNLRITIQIEKAHAEEEMKELLNKMELHAPNYLYDKKE